MKYSMDKQNQNNSLNQIAQQRYFQLNQIEKKSMNEPTSKTMNIYSNIMLNQRQFKENDQLAQKQQKSYSYQESKIFGRKLDRSISFVSATDTSSANYKQIPFSSVIQRQSNSANHISAQKLTILLSKRISQHQTTTLSTNQSKFQVNLEKINPIQINDFSLVPLEIEKVQQLNEETKYQSCFPALQVTQSKPNFRPQQNQKNKENLQKILNLSRENDRKKEKQKYNLEINPSLQNAQQDFTYPNYNTLQQHSITSPLPNPSQSNKQKIKINLKNPYSTKELVIPMPKLEFENQLSRFGSQQDLKLNQCTIINGLPNQDNNIKEFQILETITLSNEDKTQKISQSLQDDSKLSIEEKISSNEDTTLSKEDTIFTREDKILTKEDKKLSSKCQFIKEGKLKNVNIFGKQSKLNEPTKKNQCLERMRSITTQNQTPNVSNIERQISLPKIQQNSSNVNVFYKMIGRQIANHSTIQNNNQSARRISLQKRLQDLMSYNVEEEFKKRFQGMFYSKHRQQVKLVTKSERNNEIKKKVHFDEAVFI